ncbi:class I SAM-dependent methyltransferase [Pseudomarimonas arenosa]|uniref:Class I SAM-dependent methyltransferase n=1 Tax=Pseudomarimonas arenosa TaxID=2774145 RepID=A0AAW3ZCZ9_9GAMM|nr:class I SAM-dependent methyltransferase [Pseudomarimonas arenosa]MBD8524188.1 class I SAM-dependent methyltransferase [Pseudomarimonas arenosa]
MKEGWTGHAEAAFDRYHQTRAKRAAKIKTLLREAGVTPREDGFIVDVGCSTGEMIRSLTGEAALCVGVDLDASAGFCSDNLVSFAIADGEQLPFADASVNAVICNHIYEHTDQPQQLLDEIWRVLVPGGVCYFSGPSKWELIEPHYHLPFLSWLPSWLADYYMRVCGKGDHYLERPLSRRRVLGMLPRFEVESCVERILRDPVRYDSEDLIPVGSLRQKLALMACRFAPGLLPGFILMCRKPFS